MSGAVPRRASTASDHSLPTPDADSKGVRIQYLEIRLQNLESALIRQTEDANQLRVDFGSLKTEVRGMHDDLTRLNSGIVETKVEIRATIAQAGSLLKWLLGTIVTIGLFLGGTTIQTCHRNDTATTRTSTQIENLEKRDRDMQKDIQTFRNLLGPLRPDSRQP